MKRAIRIETTEIPCQKCKTRYDLVRATRRAELASRREINCPHCGNRVGTRN